MSIVQASRTYVIIIIISIIWITASWLEEADSAGRVRHVPVGDPSFIPLWICHWIVVLLQRLNCRHFDIVCLL